MSISYAVFCLKKKKNKKEIRSKLTGIIAALVHHLHSLISHLRVSQLFICSFFFFNATATTEIYTLSLHDALPILDDKSTSTAIPSAVFFMTSFALRFARR